MKPKIKKVPVENNDFQHIQVLKTNRTKRHRYGEFCVEGVRQINSALRHGWPFSALYYPEGRELSDWARDVLARAGAPVHYRMAPELMEKISEKEETSELIAAVRMRPDDLSRIELHPRMLVVILDRPNSPGNLGTSIRSCDAFGADGVIVTGHAADVYHPQAVRGSVGALFARTVVRVASHDELLTWLGNVRAALPRLQIVGSSASAERPLYDLHSEGATVLIAGNETVGMRAAYRELCDTVVTIPQQGSVSSLNVSCALSIMLYELARQRRSAAP